MNRTEPASAGGTQFARAGLFLGAASALVLAALLFEAGAARADGPVFSCTDYDLRNALAQGGYVYFTQSCSITLTLPIEISGNTTLDAAGYAVSINGGGQGPMFEVDTGVGFTNNGLTISGGESTNGGAFFINADATVLLTNCTLSGNSAIALPGPTGLNGNNSAEEQGSDGRNGAAGWPGLGGAIYSLGNLILLNCSLTGNTVTGGAGGNGGNGGSSAGLFSGGNGGGGAPGGEAYGGAVYSLGTLLATNCTFSGNTVTGGAGGTGGTGGTGAIAGLPNSGGAGGAAAGGGIYSKPGLATVVNCLFFGNSVHAGDSAAGGTESNGNGSYGKNGPNAYGGGIACFGLGAITNCTFWTNAVAAGNGGNGGNGTFSGGIGGNGGHAVGGGIYGTGSVSVVNCTIANCAASGGTAGTAGTGGGGIAGYQGLGYGGGLASGGGKFILMNSLLSTNSITPSLVGATNLYAVSGKITDAGYNFSTDYRNALTNITSLRNLDPRLGQLTNNGGPTLSMMLTNGSPAIDAITNTKAFYPPIDQRGVPRPQGKVADIGAYEAATFPAMVEQPLNLSQTNGLSLTLLAVATGNLPLSYQWRYHGTNSVVLTNNNLFITNVLDAASTNLTFPSITLTNAGYYDVVVTNRLGAVTSRMAAVSILPSITVQPTSVEAFQGIPCWFQVTAVGMTAWGDSTMYFQWQYDGVDLPDQTQVGGTNATYTFNFPDSTNNGNYTVAITSAVGGITSAIATLAVDATPYILPSNAVVAVNGSVTFSVYAAGSADFTYQWEHAQGATSPTNLVNAIGRTYTISGAQLSDAGRYQVNISGAFTPAPSAVATLSVLNPPTITAQPQSLVVTQGQSATFTVSVAGDNLSYQWSFAGAPVPGATANSYALPVVQPTNQGAYAVAITNGVGWAISNPANLTVIAASSPPPSAFSLLQPAFEFDSFSFFYQTQTNFSYILQYKDSLTDPLWTSSETNLGTGGWLTNRDWTTNAPTRFYRVLVQ